MKCHCKSLLLTVVSVLVTLGIGVTISIFFVQDKLMEDIDNQLKATLETTVSIVDRVDYRLYVASSETRSVSRLVSITFVDPDGEIVGFLPATKPDKLLSGPNISGTDIQSAIGNPITVEGVGGGPSYRLEAAEFGDDGSIVALGRPLAEVSSTLQTLSLTLLFTCAGVVVVISLITWIIYRIRLRPIEEMIDTAQTIASGDFGRRADTSHGPSETQYLGEAINTMLDQVQDSFEEKERTEHRLKQFMSDASHELRTPLTTVRGYSELYLSGAATDPDSVEKQMGRINSEATRMDILVENLLTIARYGHGMGMKREPIEISRILTDTVTDLRAVADDHSIELNLNIGSSKVIGDDDRLRQVFSNLCSNAYIHTPAGTKITIDATSSEKEILVTVQDDGLGMEVEVAEHVFEGFFRAEDDLVLQKNGLGLGLSIAEKIVRAHGGSISLETKPGSGSIFTVVLPRELAKEFAKV